MDGKLRNMTSLYLTKGESVLCLYRIGSRVVGNSYTGAAGGHIEAEEYRDPRACVLRELQEETGLSAQLIPGFREMVSYPMSGGKTKQVVLFPGQVTGAVTLQKTEATAFRWVCAEEAKHLLHPDFAPVMDRIRQYLEERHE